MITSVGLTSTVTLGLRVVALGDGEGVADGEGMELAALIGSIDVATSIETKAKEILRIT